MKSVWKFAIAGFFVCGFHAAGIAQVEPKGPSEIGLIESTQAQDRENIKGIGELLGHFGKFVDAASSGSAMYSAMSALDNNECVPDLAASASGLMPSGCDGNAGCNQCFESAVNRMNTVRKNLARMSCLRMNTKRYVDSAVAFGDDVSGIHGAMGLAWQKERRGINASYEKFKKTYDGKYVEMMESLDTSLKGIDVCEAQFGMKDWYQKSGFIYYELMKEKYQRTD